MEDHLRGSEWFGGYSMNIADIALYAYTHVADEGGFDSRGLSLPSATGSIGSRSSRDMSR